MNTNANARTAERRGESGRMRGVLHDAEKSGKSGARDAKKGRRGASCFGLRDTSQGLTQPLLDPPTGQLSPLSPSHSCIRLFLCCGDPLRAGRYFSINNNLHRARAPLFR